MSEPAAIAFAGCAGLALGALFYGGLWWTVRRGVGSAQPVAWFLTSLVVRTAIALLGFYAVCRGDWRRLLGCLAGFILARLLVMRLTRLPPVRPPCPINEGTR